MHKRPLPVVPADATGTLVEVDVVSPPAEGSGNDGDDSDETHGDSAAAFAALSDPLRVDILRALSDHHRETRSPEPIGFADLRRRVGVRDSGRFRYHLERLRDHFVEKTDEGYRLTPAGTEVVAAVIAGTYSEQVSLDPTELDSGCFICGEPAVATYDRGVCWVTCANEHPLFQWSVPPNAAARATSGRNVEGEAVKPPEQGETATLLKIVEVAELLAVQAVERSLAGICSKCYGPVEPEVIVEDGSEQVGFRTACDACGGQLLGPIGFCLLVDPEVAAFYRQHGRTIREHHLWELSFVQGGSTITVVSEEPIRVEIGVRLDDERLCVSVDDTGRVISVERSDATN